MDTNLVFQCLWNVHCDGSCKNWFAKLNWKGSLEISFFGISEEEVAITKYCPNAAVNLWFDRKVRQLNCSSHSYPKQWKATASSSKDVIGITELTMSILEAEKEGSIDNISL